MTVHPTASTHSDGPCRAHTRASRADFYGLLRLQPLLRALLGLAEEPDIVVLYIARPF